MKKILCLLVLLPLATPCNDEISKNFFSTLFTAGYVFKRDCSFKEVYSPGLVNAITADGCYHFSKGWGIGTKISYLFAHGHTTLFKQKAHIQEIPLTFYVRKGHDFKCGLELYGSLGGGLVWLKEKSYLGCAHTHKGIGEVELGLTYSIWRCLNLTSAFRYLFPCRQSSNGKKIDVGGFDIRAGIELPF